MLIDKYNRTTIEQKSIMQNNESNMIIYTTQDGKASVTLYTRDGKVWLNQQQIAKLFGTSKLNVNRHIASALKDNGLGANSVVKNYLTTAFEGERWWR